MKKLAAAAAAVVLLAGCSSGNTVTTTTRTLPPSTPTATPTPSPTVWTLAQAARQYLTMVAPGNAVIHKENPILQDTNASLPATQAAMRKIDVAQSVFARALAAGLWPAAVRPKIDALISAISREHSADLGQIYAKTWDDFNRTQSEWDAANTAAGAAAEDVRVALGLPDTTNT